MAYDLEFKYVKGKDLIIADALSRSPTMNQNRSKIEQEIETTRLLTEDPRVTNSLSEIAEETAKDDVLQFYSSTVIHHISEGWKTDKRHIPIQILPFWSVEDELLLSDGIVYRGDRLVMPATLLKSPYVLEHPFGGQG